MVSTLRFIDRPFGIDGLYVGTDQPACRLFDTRRSVLQSSEESGLKFIWRVPG